MQVQLTLTLKAANFLLGFLRNSSQGKLSNARLTTATAFTKAIEAVDKEKYIFNLDLAIDNVLAKYQEMLISDQQRTKEYIDSCLGAEVEIETRKLDPQSKQQVTFKVDESYFKLCKELFEKREWETLSRQQILIVGEIQDALDNAKKE